MHHSSRKYLMPEYPEWAFVLLSMCDEYMWMNGFKAPLPFNQTPHTKLLPTRRYGLSITECGLVQTELIRDQIQQAEVVSKVLRTLSKVGLPWPQRQCSRMITSQDGRENMCRWHKKDNIDWPYLTLCCFSEQVCRAPNLPAALLPSLVYMALTHTTSSGLQSACLCLHTIPLHKHALLHKQAQYGSKLSLI